MGVLTKELRRQVANQVSTKQKRTLRTTKKLRPIFFTYDTLDCGKVDEKRTRHYRTTSF